MAQVIKLKRSAVAGKTPQTSSLELGELGINTSDGKIYFHRSSSSDDSIQSVLTTDATITGSLKLSGSQHISGSTNIMDDLSYGGNLTASLGSTSSFDRFTSVGTSSIGFLIASGSNLLNLTEAETGSFASGSDVQQILDESGSYLVDADTGSLGNISGSINSTASFGAYIGDGSQLSGVTAGVDATSVSGSFLGLFSGSDDLTLGGGISGSIVSTASFGFYKGDGSGLSNVTTDTTAFASGSDLHQILAESSSYVVESETGSFVVNSQTSSFASGSDLQIIQAESASYVVSTNTGSFLQNSDTASFQSTIITSSLEITGSIQIDGDESAIDLTTNGLRKFQIAKNTSDDFKINRYDGGGSFLDQPLSIASSSGITTILDELTRSGGVTRLIGGGSTQDGVGVYNDKKVGIGTGTTAIGDDKFLVAGDTGITGSLFVSSSITTPTTGSFGRVVTTNLDADGGVTIDNITIDGTEIDLSSGDLTLDVEGDIILDANGADIKLKDDGTEFGRFSRVSSDLVIKSISNNNDILLKGVDGSSTITALQLDMSEGGDAIFNGGVSASLGKTGSFDRLEGVTLNASISPFASGSDVSQIQAQTGSYASGSDLHQFLAESASYLVDAVTSSMGATSINSTLFVQGNISTSGSITANEYIVNSSVTNVTQSFSSGSTIFGDTIDDTHKFTGSLEVSSSIRLQGDNSKFFLSSASGDFFTHIGNHRPKLVTAGVERFRVTSAGHVVFNEEGNDMDFRIESSDDINAFKVDASTNTLAIGSTPDNVSKLKVAGDVGITGSLNVSGSITSNQTPNVHSLSGSLHVSGGAGGVLHLSSSVADEPMIQFHQSASNDAVLLQTDEYGAGLWHVKEYSGANHNGHLIGQTLRKYTI